ncbi:DUF5707 domain-containing protein [Streptomyces sp. ITFR-6]|uniref:DUF5707 domain-containing protein n=1 Tax=Streptomyces sp. ITFR-6 TaxID=3075197 RepID=UPI00288C4B9C|nr:DUF5707 domain-containing protein [Streptomyces sp. ITFR-6]WNI27778.1 DUF5707 domain-containing protein [Streptomyces sp. ITFR-6]
MSKRVIATSLAGTAVLGAAGAVAFAAQASEAKPQVRDGEAAYVTPHGTRDGSLTFTVHVSDDSGVRGVKVLAWPGTLKPAPTAKEMKDVESAKCAAAGDGAARCTYTVKVTEADAVPAGAWHVAVLATAKDGDTAFVPRAADFTARR